MAEIQTTAQMRHEKWAVEYADKYHHEDRGAVLSALSDAAHMCDAISFDLIAEGTVRGKVKKEARLAADAVKRAGDAIWAMREKMQ